MHLSSSSGSGVTIATVVTSGEMRNVTTVPGSRSITLSRKPSAEAVVLICSAVAPLVLCLMIASTKWWSVSSSSRVIWSSVTGVLGLKASNKAYLTLSKEGWEVEVSRARCRRRALSSSSVNSQAGITSSGGDVGGCGNGADGGGGDGDADGGGGDGEAEGGGGGDGEKPHASALA